MRVKVFVFVAFYVTSTECWIPKPLTRSSKLINLPYSSVDPGDPLILTPLIEGNKLDEARQASKVSHPDFQGLESYSGFITVNKNFDSNLFFWFFPSQTSYENDPVVIWLQGGPGGSSLFGLFVENGPFKVDKPDTLTLRNYTWTKEHSVLFIDNPAGTGFSYTKPGGFATEETQVGNELFEFLQQFYTLFSELQKNDLYITGESYGGKYVPAIGYAILKKNPEAKVKINLKGLAIGDGFTDPIHQYEYADYLYQIGLVDETVKDELKVRETELLTHVTRKEWVLANRCSNVILGIYSSKSGIKNPYNYLLATDPTVRLDGYSSRYLERNDVRLALHVGSLPYDSEGVYENLEADIMQSVAPWVAELLSNYRVLLYTGQVDVIVAYPLTLNYLQHLSFSSAEEYKNAPRKIWYADSELAGYAKVAGNLTEVLVRDAGHMVPYDQPKWAYDLIYKFVRNIPLGN